MASAHNKCRILVLDNLIYSYEVQYKSTDNFINSIPSSPTQYSHTTHNSQELCTVLIRVQWDALRSLYLGNRHPYISMDLQPDFLPYLVTINIDQHAICNSAPSPCYRL